MINVCDGDEMFRTVPFIELRKELLQFEPNDTLSRSSTYEYSDDSEISFGTRIFTYRNFKCNIHFGSSGNFCGYVDEIDPELSDVLTEFEMTHPSDVQGVYIPHGNFTHVRGFDCAHGSDSKFNAYFFDRSYAFLVERPRGTFKSEKFVESEIRKIVDSIIYVANARR